MLKSRVMGINDRVASIFVIKKWQILSEKEEAES